MSRVAAAYAVSYTQYRFVLQHFAIIQERFFLVNLFTLFFTGAIMLKHCRYSSSVEHDLPKVERWVRFPLPAREKRMQRVLHPFVLCLGMSFFLYIVGRNGEGVQYIGKKKVNFLGSLNGQSHHKKMHRRDAFARSRWQRY